MEKIKLTQFEQKLVKEMNTRAMLIIQIDETLKNLKLPMDREVLYSMDEEQLKGLLEMLDSAIENRKKYGRIETTD